jgi:DNA-binding winged helix-turn-helix (wHTH) protein
MASDGTPQLTSGDLSVHPDLGEVRNARGECGRLGPVNMRVLALLVRRAGQVVSRTEIFDTVWTNQVVSDDVLTRAISDIRAELGRLSEREGHIETIPKRGYRWTGGTAAPSSHKVVARLGRLLSYLAVLVLIASLGVWLLVQFARPGPPVIALLPTRAEAPQLALATMLDAALTESLLAAGNVELLSRTAVETRPTNPFPYFYYEFGARWLVESELRELPGRTLLTTAVVDARTGIVLFQRSEPVEDRLPAGVEKALAEFLVSELAR